MGSGPGDDEPRGVTVQPSAVIGLLIALVVLGVGVFFPSPDGVSPSAQRALAVFLTALILWLTRPLPYIVSSILCVVLLFVLGTVDSFAAAATGYTSTLVFFLLLLLLLANTISSVGLDVRLAERLLVAERSPFRTFGSIAGSVLALALVMPSSMARAITFIPVVDRLATRFGPSEGFERGSYLLLGHVNPIASMALMTGGGMALVTSEIVNESVRTVTWVEWAVMMLPPTVVLYGLATASAGLLANIDGTKRTETDESLPTDEDPEPVTRDQYIVGGVTLGAVVGWVVGSFVGLPTILPAIVAVAVLALPGVEIITAEDIAEVSWGIIFLIGAMLSILDVMETTGAITLVVEGLTRWIPFAALTQWQVVLALLAMAVGIRILFSTGSAAIVVILPIVLEFGGVFGVDRLYLALSVLLVVGSTTILPFNTTAVLVSMDRGSLSHHDVARFGVLTMLLSLVVVAVSWLVYWPLVA